MVNGADFPCLPEADLPDPAHHRSPDESDGSGESAERDGGSLRKRCRRQDRRGAGDLYRFIPGLRWETVRIDSTADPFRRFPGNGFADRASTGTHDTVNDGKIASFKIL